MRILLAEDEAQMSQAESAFLRMRGFEVDTAENGARALELARERVYDVMVLDIMMPVMDGLTALRELRRGGDTTPVILLTAKAEVDDRIDGLSAGADDYLTKPFSLKELEARVRAQIRRSARFGGTVLTYRGVRLDAGELELSCRSSVRLAGKEARLMELFLRSPEKTLTPRELLERVWPESGEGSGEAVYLYISYLRQKLRSIAADAEIAGDGETGYTLRGVEG